ncbi:MAG: heme ABC exporter ATP-binding protein CcmA [Gammaproteobacteria bacterium]
MTLVVSELEVWRGDYCVCAGWNVRMEAGQALRLRGGNGAGKTSLIRIFAGLALPESGQVRYGEAGHSPRAAAYREDLRYVAHRDGIKRELGARENLRLSARLMADSQPDAVDGALERVGLGAFATRLAGELSAGQRRRLALARVLLGQARLWLLDEPLVSLDQSGVALVETLVREHLSAGGMAIIATHQPLALEGLDVLNADLPLAATHVR